MSYLFHVNNGKLDSLSSIVPEDIISWAKESSDVLIYGIGEDEKTIGAAAVRLSGTRAELLWYYVDSAFRGYGIGSKSFYSLLSDIYDLGAREIAVEIYPDTDNGIKNLIRGYHVNYEELPVCFVRFKAGEITKVPELLRTSKHSIPLGSCSKEELKGLQEKLEKTGNDLMDITAEGYISSLSTVYKKDGEALGVLLFEKKSEDEVTLSFAASVARDAVSILDMLRHAASGIKQLPPEIMVGMNIVNPKMRDMALKLLMPSKYIETEEAKLAVLTLDFINAIRAKADGISKLLLLREKGRWA